MFLKSRNKFVEFMDTGLGVFMFPSQTTQTAHDELFRCRDLSQILAEEKDNSNVNSRADNVLAQEVDHALWKNDVLRAMDYCEIDVDVKNGIVYLSGHIVSTTSKGRIENAIQAIPGVLGIKSRLVLDDELTIEVASSLGELEHNYNCKFFTGVSYGVVSLSGMVSDENVKSMAEKCAASNPNVRGVINSLRVQGSDLVIQDQILLRPTIGADILFLDGVSGVVKQVIINPDNRQVVAMTLWGRFADQSQELESLQNSEARFPEHLIVLSMDLVRYLTKLSGSLLINSNEKTRFMDFDPSAYNSPNPGWVPPYPYCPIDVLIPFKYRAADEVDGNGSERAIPAIKLGKVLTEQLLANDSLGG